MCQAVPCRTCGKTTWSGCGEHIDAVKRGVPAAQWCDGTHSADEISAATAGRPGIFARLFGR